MKYLRTISLFLPCCNRVASTLSFSSQDDDLMRFVSAPHIRAPYINVTNHYPDRTTSGYWFVAPYAGLKQQSAGNLYVPAQSGPHIYTDDGTLIWSGAEMFPTRSVCDFRMGTTHGHQRLSFIVVADRGHAQYPDGAGIILDNSYAVLNTVSEGLPTPAKFDEHEFNIQDNSSTAVLIYSRAINPRGTSDITNLTADSGFMEIEIDTSQVRFQWEASRHLDRNTSSIAQPLNRSHNIWDWIHMNSVDRTDSGNFLVSGRHTDAIYMISGLDGSIMWQLGGVNSSFKMQGWNFSRQHDARVLSQNATTTMLTFLNNAFDGIEATATSSSALLVALNHVEMTANLIMQIVRPDKALSPHRGNVQALPDGNILVAWSGEDGYMTEHSSDGQLLQEARFRSNRLSTYRAYKYFDFVGAPFFAPSLKTFTYASGGGETVTVFYVSWNGATEVDSWNFYMPLASLRRESVLVGTTRKYGFETVYTVSGQLDYVFAEAMNAEGQSLRNSSITQTTVHGVRSLSTDGQICHFDFTETPKKHNSKDFQLSTPDTIIFNRPLESLYLVLLGFGLSYMVKLARRKQL